MSKRYAMIKDGIVENICMWDGVAYSEENPTAWSPPAEYTMIDAEGVFCNIGWSWDGEKFQDPTGGYIIDESTAEISEE